MTAGALGRSGPLVLRAGVLLSLAGLGACGDQVREFTRPDDGGVNRQYVVGAAAAALDADGRFQVSQRRTWSRPELSEGEARRLALVYVKKFPRTNAAYYERIHGTRIDFDELQLCGRAFYAMSPYEEPPGSMHEGMVNSIAPHWIFTFCRPGEIPVISTAIAATATRLDFSDPSSQRGSEIFSTGIPVGKVAMPLPERAVEQLAIASGRRVATVPELVMRGMGTDPQSAQWRLGLDGPVAATDSAGKMIDRLALYVGRAIRTWDVEINDGVSPAPGDQIEEVRDPLAGTRYQLIRGAGMPRRFMRVQLRTGSAQ